MYNIILNIGYDSGELGGGILNSFPVYATSFENTKEITNWIRLEISNIVLWSNKFYVPVKSMCLFLVIYYPIEDGTFESQFKIKCKNVREYKKFLNMTHEEIDAFCSQEYRNDKIEKLLN